MIPNVERKLLSSQSRRNPFTFLLCQLQKSHKVYFSFVDIQMEQLPIRLSTHKGDVYYEKKFFSAIIIQGLE